MILFTICGRAGSKGIKNKNIRGFLGKPLVYYTLSVIDIFRNDISNNDFDIALNTDSRELNDIVQKFTRLNVTYIPREDNLGTDKVAKKDVIIDTLLKMEIIKGYHYDVVIDLDITSPLRTLSNLKEAIDKQKKSDADVVFSVAPSRRNPFFNMVKETKNGYKKVMDSNYTTRQDAPDIYDMNASIYVYKSSHLRKGKGVLEGYNEIITMKDTGILDLDHEGDFELMEVIAKYFFETREEYKEIYLNI